MYHIKKKLKPATPRFFLRPPKMSQPPCSPVPCRLAMLVDFRRAIQDCDKRIAELEGAPKEQHFILDSVRQWRGWLEEEEKKRAELEARNKGLQDILTSVRRVVERLEGELEECQEERDDFEGQHECAELALEEAKKKHAEEIKGRDERIAELEKRMEELP